MVSQFGDVRVEIRGARDVQRWLSRVSADVVKAADKAAKESAYAIRDEAKTYEAPIGGRPWRTGPGPVGGFYSERQRRYVMAAITSGRIQIPYQRTGTMSRQTVAGRVPGKRAAWYAEMRAPYSIFVRGSMISTKQFFMHEGQWTKWHTIVNRHRNKYWYKIRSMVARAIRKRA